MVEKILASSSGGSARSLRILGRMTESLMGASASQMPRTSLSERIAENNRRALITKSFAPGLRQNARRRDYAHRR